MEYHTACSLGECEKCVCTHFHISSLASVAQLVEHPPDTRTVEGSTPSACTNMIFPKSRVAIKGFFRSIFGLPYNVEHTREAIRLSYKRHVLAAQKGEIPLNGGMTPHAAGLYGALATRHMAAGIRRSEILLFIELAPFLLMKESEAIDSLAEYVVCQENPKDGETVWLSNLINNALRTLENADPNYKAMATQVLLHRDIYWRNFLEKDVNELLENELLKNLPPGEQIAPEIYILMDFGLRAKVDKLKV